MMEDLNFLPVKDAATLLGVTPQYVRKLIREQTLPGQKIGNVWLVEKSSVQQYRLQRFGPMFPLDNCSEEDVADGKPIALSFFSGAMGLDLGIEQAGFEFRLACEFDKTCQKTIQMNRPDVPLIGNILDYKAEDIRRISGVGNRDIDLIVGGPPCQAFSTAGARKGFEDARGNVFLDYINLLLELRPKYAVIENVRGLLSAQLKSIPLEEKNPTLWGSILGKPGGALLYILEKMRDGGYTVSFNLYNAANFGVPQVRERVVLVCSRDAGKVPYLMPTCSNDPKWGLPKWRTFKEAVSGLNQCHHSDFPEKRLQYFRMLGPGQYWKDLPQEVQPVAMGKSFYLGGGKTGFYRRLAWDKPSCTLVTSPTMPATDICHPEEDRPLSIEEYKRIQMFPDDWQLSGNLMKQYKQVGNAVPVQLGKAIGETVLRHMKGEAKSPPEGFPFSRYKNTDDVSWEKITRQNLGLDPKVNLCDPGD